MPSFPKPTFDFNYDVDAEIAAIRNYRDTKPGRQIPSKQDDRLLVASWNIANLGLQDRRSDEYKLLAEIISWFDVIAIQEVNDNLEGLRGIQDHLPNNYFATFSDKAGNDERAAFLIDGNKVSTLELFGEISVPPAEQRHIKLPGVTRQFRGFDRTPVLMSFSAGEFEFVIVNVHLYFGDDNTTDRQRRALEAYATSRWGDLRRDDAHSYVENIITVGDFNIPKVEPGDLIYTALRRRGMQRPEHSTQIASNIANDKHYDQIMFFPGATKDRFTGQIGVFDFDGALFGDLWATRSAALFRGYLRYYISDHRPIWAEFDIG